MLLLGLDGLIPGVVTVFSTLALTFCLQSFDHVSHRLRRANTSMQQGQVRTNFSTECCHSNVLLLLANASPFGIG